MKKFLFVLSILSLCSCATTSKYKEILNSYVGKPKSTLVAKWGVPDSIYRVDKNTEMLKYVDETLIVNGKMYCYTNFTITDGIVSDWSFNGNTCRAR